MKIRKKNFIIFALSILLILQSALPVFAELYFQTSQVGLWQGAYTPRMTTQPSDIKYYVSSTSTFSAYATYIISVLPSWNGSAYDISMARTTTYSESIIDIKGYGNTSAYAPFIDLLGFTRVYCGDGAYGGNNEYYTNASLVPEDYWMAEVFINRTTIDPSTTAGRNMLKTVALHEVGHALGLGHSGTTSSLMYESYYSTQPVTVPNSFKSAVYDLYHNRTGTP